MKRFRISNKLQDIIEAAKPKKTEQTVIKEVKVCWDYWVETGRVTKEESVQHMKTLRPRFRKRRSYEKRVLKILQNAKRDIAGIKKEFVNSESDDNYPFFRNWF